VSIPVDSGSLKDKSPLKTIKKAIEHSGIKQLISTASPNMILPMMAPILAATYVTPIAVALKNHLLFQILKHKCLTLSFTPNQTGIFLEILF
jgi:hypothetical protein